MNTENDRNDCIRTTIYLPRSLYEDVKIMAIFTRSNVSALMRVALRDKLNDLKVKSNGKHTFKS